MSHPIESDQVIISGDARYIKKHGPPSPLQPVPVPASPAEAKQAWKRIKPELYAIGAVIVDKIVDQALDTELRVTPPQLRKTVKVRDFFAMTTPFHNLGAFMRDGLKTVIDQNVDREKLAQVDPGDYSNWDRTLARYFVLEQFHRTYVRKPVFADDHNVFLKRGARTIAVVVPLTPLLTLDVWSNERKTEPDIDVLQGINGRSYGVVQKQAKLHLHAFSRADDELMGEERGMGKVYDAWKFTLKPRADGEYLDFVDDLSVYEEPEDPEAPKDTEEYGPRAGCLAEVNFGEGSAIHRLWQWNLKHAPILYEEYSRQLKLEAPEKFPRVDIQSIFKALEKDLEISPA